MNPLNCEQSEIHNTRINSTTKKHTTISHEHKKKYFKTYLSYYIAAIFSIQINIIIIYASQETTLYDNL